MKYLVLRTSYDFNNGLKIPLEYLAPNTQFSLEKVIITSEKTQSYRVPENPSLIPTADGKIDQILLTIPSYALERLEEELKPIYVTLFKTLPQYTHFLIAVNKNVKQTLETMLEECGIRDRSIIVNVPDILRFSIWAQDSYAITQDGDKTYFAEPFYFKRKGDAMVKDFFVKEHDIFKYHVPLVFQGGNILVGDDFWLFGINYLYESYELVRRGVVNIRYQKKGETKDDYDRHIQKSLEELYPNYLDKKRRMIVLKTMTPCPLQTTIEFKGKTYTFYTGNSKPFVDNETFSKDNHQPLFHIDMFITLVGRNNKTGKYRVLVGDPKVAADLLKFQDDRFERAILFSKGFDEIAKQLEGEGFEVIRNPLPIALTCQPDEDEEVVESEEKSYRWYFATYNNCLVENSEKSKTVWLPTYGHGKDYEHLKVTDDENERIFKDCGFNVIRLPSCHRLANCMGVVHCITKYLKRS